MARNNRNRKRCVHIRFGSQVETHIRSRSTTFQLHQSQQPYFLVFRTKASSTTTACPEKLLRNENKTNETKTTKFKEKRGKRQREFILFQNKWKSNGRLGNDSSRVDTTKCGKIYSIGGMGSSEEEKWATDSETQTKRKQKYKLLTALWLKQCNASHRSIWRTFHFFCWFIFPSFSTGRSRIRFQVCLLSTKRLCWNGTMHRPFRLDCKNKRTVTNEINFA